MSDGVEESRGQVSGVASLAFAVTTNRATVGETPEETDD
jgi:hypothetical protein